MLKVIILNNGLVQSYIISILNFTTKKLNYESCHGWYTIEDGEMISEHGSEHDKTKMVIFNHDWVNMRIYYNVQVDFVYHTKLARLYWVKPSEYQNIDRKS